MALLWRCKCLQMAEEGKEVISPVQGGLDANDIHEYINPTFALCLLLPIDLYTPVLALP
jgi:hypothetical protein